MIRFTFDCDYQKPEHTFTARRKGEAWNGFLRPYVDEENLRAVAARFNAITVENDGDYRIELADGADGAVVIHEYEVGEEKAEPIATTVLEQDSDELYYLNLGWTLVSDNHYG